MQNRNFVSDSLDQAINKKFQSNSLNVLNFGNNSQNFNDIQPQNNNFQKSIYQNMLLDPNIKLENYQNQVFSCF